MTEDYEPKRRILIYGEPKCGKTRSWATLPKGTKVYYVDVDRQAGTLLQDWKKRGHPRSNLKLIKIDTTIDTTTDEGAEEMFRSLRKALWAPPEGYDFYIVDCYTTVGLLLTHTIVGVGDRNYDQRNNTDLAAYVTDLFWQFAGSAERYGAWLGVVMHEKWREIKDPENPNPQSWRDKKEILAPEVASGARITIPSQIDFVFHVERGRSVVGGKSKAISKFRTRGTPQIMASTVGYDGVLADLEPADFEAIFKKLKVSHKATVPKKARQSQAKRRKP